MTRPQTVQDVFESLCQNRLLEPARLHAFVDRHRPTDVITTLERLVSDGLLTIFQASEVANGRGAMLWLGGYRLLDRLGKGAMGAVFLAEHSVLGRRVAVKTLSESLRADPAARKRFVREARAAATLDHPNIVRVFDVNMNNDPPYIVMEYVDGVSLQAAVSQTGTFSTGETGSIGVQVADGLVQAASVGLVHRDIKPANLLVDRRGAAKILDLGIVRFTYDDTFSRLNGADVILGTLDYLAPEQAEDSSRVDARADLYGLGATLYFLLAGQPPYPTGDPRRKLIAKRTTDPPPIHHLRPDVPPEFSAIIARLMARDPAERYASPALAVAALYQWSNPGTDFPSRLFRMTSESTDHDRRNTDHEPPRESIMPMPDTVLIVKTGLRRNTETSDANVSASAMNSPSELPEMAPENFPDYSELSPTNVGAPAVETEDGNSAALTDEIGMPREMREQLDIARRQFSQEAASEPPSESPSPSLPAVVPKSSSRWIAAVMVLAAALLLAAALIVILTR